ncbi:FAD binding domain-containing protein [Xylaria venustula]|nr:FAD binding domain-containing protein [Xylaria venustula]
MIGPRTLLSLFYITAVSSTFTDPGYDCRPGQHCWPSSKEWNQFKVSIDGRLHQTVPIAAPCYADSPYYDEAACKVVQDYYDDNPTEPLYGNCSLARLASYYVDVRNPSDISAAIKNTGHDYCGKSSVPNTLAIWTHNLDTFNFYPNFTAHSCPASNVRISHSMDITGGYEQSVGLAGGFAQGGGVGSFTTSYGLMADNAVEFEVVTADGEVRIVNQCNDPELFWAMRGGGGGTYAILTKYRVQVYPSLPIHVYSFKANFALLTGQIEYFPERFSVGLVLPYGDDGAKLKAATASFAQFLNRRTDLAVTSHGYVSYTNYAAYLDVTAADAKVTEPSGIFSLFATRLIPREVFTSPDTIDELVEGVMQGIATSRSILNLAGTQIVPETPVTNLDSSHLTSVHPAWRTALWHVVHAGEWLEPLDEFTMQRTTGGFLEMIEPLKKLSPGGGVYLNEAHYLEPDWQQTFFGSNYDRLLQVKEKYDPTHIFDCYKCVGWRGQKE